MTDVQTPVSDGEQAVREKFEEVGLMARDYMGVEPEVGKYNVRGLKVKDFRRVKDAVTKALHAVRENQPDAGENISGFAILEALLGDTFDEVMDIADDLLEEDEPLDELPYDALLSVVETVVEREDLPRTVARFLRLRQVFSKSLTTNSSSDTGARS
jgi:hypothetical protein